MKTGDLLKIAWDPDKFYIVKVVGEERGFFILQNQRGKQMICRPNSLCHVEVLGEHNEIIDRKSTANVDMSEVLSVTVLPEGVEIGITNGEQFIFLNATTAPSNHRLEIEKLIQALQGALDAHSCKNEGSGTAMMEKEDA